MRCSTMARPTPALLADCRVCMDFSSAVLVIEPLERSHSEKAAFDPEAEKGHVRVGETADIERVYVLGRGVGMGECQVRGQQLAHIVSRRVIDLNSAGGARQQTTSGRPRRRMSGARFGEPRPPGRAVAEVTGPSGRSGWPQLRGGRDARHAPTWRASRLLDPLPQLRPLRLLQAGHLDVPAPSVVLSGVGNSKSAPPRKRCSRTRRTRLSQRSTRVPVARNMPSSTRRRSEGPGPSLGSSHPTP